MAVPAEVVRDRFRVNPVCLRECDVCSILVLFDWRRHRGDNAFQARFHRIDEVISGVHTRGFDEHHDLVVEALQRTYPDLFEDATFEDVREVVAERMRQDLLLLRKRLNPRNLGLTAPDATRVSTLQTFFQSLCDDIGQCQV